MSKVDLIEFTRKLDALSQAYGRMPTEIAAIAVNFSKDRFRDQAWLDTTKHPWKKRATRRAGGTKRSQTLLVDSGRLKRSIRKISANENAVIIGTDTPYAKAHNEGFKGKVTQNVRAHKRAKTKVGIVKRTQRKRSTRIDWGRVKTGEIDVRAYKRVLNQNIPARPFMGQSYTLMVRIQNHATAQFIKALRK